MTACTLGEEPAPQPPLGRGRRQLGTKLTLDLTGFSRTALPRSTLTCIEDTAAAAATSGGGAGGPECLEGLYELGAVLGSGTTAVVRSARSLLAQGPWQEGQELAVKCVSGADEELRRFAQEEHELLRSLCHRSIIAVGGMYESVHGAWICMELCTDGSVDARVRRCGAFVEEAARALCLQLFHGVNYLHGKRIVHRDLKPSNVLLTEGATSLKIVDFNSAKRIGGGAGASAMLTDRGTHDFSAPELRFGTLWNERVDEWACGLCLYFMLQAALPFAIMHRATAQVLRSGKLPPMHWDTAESPTSAASEAASCGAGGTSILMRNLVLQCLTVNMHDRPPVMELLMHPVFHQHDKPLQAAMRHPVFGHMVRPSSSEDRGPVVGLRGSSRSSSPPSGGRSAATPRSPRRHGSWAAVEAEVLGGALGGGGSGSWREGRNGRDVLERLAHGRCERTMGQDSAGDSVDSPLSPPAPGDAVDGNIAQARLVHRRVAAKARAADGMKKPRRFFTTHGAALFSEAEAEVEAAAV
mmetsp:Transcript_57916/g.186004  ORF Transcript_57916/g.186004 Transcript_57916/m.186004 type:complete len:526 (+) Transcript_57916:99-1676(+)